MKKQRNIIVGIVCAVLTGVGIAQTPKETNAVPDTVLVTNIHELNTTSYLTNVTWYVNGANPIDLNLSTNLSVNWITVEEINDTTPARFAVSRFDNIKQVGTVQTNRLLTIIHDNATNILLLKVLGKQEWPTQTRTLQVPARNRP